MINDLPKITETSPKANIFITTDVLCGWTLNQIKDTSTYTLRDKSSSSRFFKSGLVTLLSTKYKVFVIQKASYPPGIGLLVKEALENEAKNCVFPYTYWENFNTTQIPDMIDFVTLDPNATKLPFLYIDTMRTSLMDSLIEDHRWGGLKAAGMLISVSRGFRQDDLDLIMNFYETSKKDLFLEGQKSGSLKLNGSVNLPVS